MALSYGFFDAELTPSGQYDRAYAAEQFAEYFHLIVSNGVFPDPATQLQVVASDTPNMNVNVSDGYGWINGYYAKNSGPYPLAIQAASGTLNRIDAIVLRWVNASRSMELAVKTGIAASSPATPALQRDTDVYELMLATVTVAAGATSIPQSSITDKRSDTSVCGWVTGAVQNIDTTNLFAQYDTAFQEWFDNIKSQLSGDVATNLQNQINKNAAGIANINATTLKADTKTALGLPASAGPDDAFKVLVNVGNLHVWEKSEKANPIVYSSSSVAVKLTSTSTYTFGRTVEIENGAIVLKNTFTEKGNANSSILVGCYFKRDGVVYRVDGFNTNTSTTTTWNMIEVSIDTSSYVPGNTIEYKTSTDSSSYPADGVQDDYYYTYVGQLGESARIEVGSYVGTGTYGSSNPNSLTFGFEPKMVIIAPKHTKNWLYGFALTYQGALWVQGEEKVMTNYASSSSDMENSTVVMTLSGKTLMWYSTYDATKQLNDSGRTFIAVAIG